MASFEDYDEFGNYIGADLDSDDDEEMQQETFGREASAPAAQPLEGFEEEPMTGVEEGALMQIDGAFDVGVLSDVYGTHIVWCHCRAHTQCCHFA